ncbi:hypothetical protein Leryth_019983 [Lithospermum erythrorhizon]|uniref:Single-stranded DNA binding protein Ssb-like OB fold domain-containing protein n=1 Tax=Lithospermum erythrorhizon TaxID=34254 RepID=A0AAV3QMM9_LITER|nr:hypothetical protein Leryth_019983 [Lithospermum erythrorhizon]
MAEQNGKQSLKKVTQLRPLDSGVNINVKVVNTKMIAPRGRSQGRFAEALVGDDTGIIVLTARNDQVDLVKEGNTLQLSNAKVDIFKGSMRLAADRSGKIEVSEPASFSVKEANNMSLIEFERIDVVV